MTELNPYTPPKDDEPPPKVADPKAPSYRLYTPAHVGLAVFLGAPIAGCFLLALNRYRLGQAPRARMTILMGVVATAFLFLTAEFTPSAVSHSLPIGAMIGIWSYARMDQPLLDRHLSDGGRKEPTWKAALIALGFLVVGLVLFVLLLVVWPGFDVPPQ